MAGGERDKDNVAEYYDRLAEREWERLAKDAYHGLEFRGTMACLEEHLPGSGRVLDVGGGPGRYAIELCRRGYRVTLLDVSPRCVALAREKFAKEPEEVRARLEGAEAGDVRDLSRFATGAFDALLCLAPLSHVLDPADRRKATCELVRVVRPGGPVFISVIGYFAVLRTVLVRTPEEFVEHDVGLERGDHLYHGGFCDAHFFRPEELRALAEEAGLETLEMRALEGLSSNLAEATNALREHDDGRWERWLEILDRTCREPAVVAMSEHFLYVGRAVGCANR